MSMEEKRASAMRIFEALSGVDEELLAKAEREVPVDRIPNRKKITAFGKSPYAGALVAAACIMVVCLALWRTGGYQFVTKEAATGGAAPAAMVEEPALEQAVVEEAALEQAEVEAAPAEENMVASESADEAGAVGGQESNKLEDLKQEKYEKAETEAQTESLMICGLTSLKDPFTDITEEEARATEKLGKYVPTLLPAGYAWESGGADILEETGECRALYLTWTRDLDTISITIKAVDASEVQLADVEEKESYNVHLYEIPYADSVPDKYFESFHQPVFAAQDFTKEVVEMRMKSVADAGDTDTPRGDFEVYYEEGVQVRFNGRGEPSEIWEMFQSME